MEERKDTKGLSRRDFMKAAGVTAAGVVASSLIADSALAAKPVTAQAQGRVIGANDRINVAFIGIGGMGGGHLQGFKNQESNWNVSCVAVCEVWDKRKQNAQKVAGCPDNMVFGDYRKLLENKDIDAVVVATPDHWHAPIAIAAMEMGKHVYVEKPMTHTLEEAFQMHETTLRTKRIVQVGSQGCTDPKWHQVGRAVKDGKIGTVLWAQGGYCRNNPNGEWNWPIDSSANMGNLDWKMWLGDAPKRDFDPDRYFRWRKFWDYGNGIIGDLWPHRLHPLMIAMASDEYPKRVACLGSNVLHTDKGFGEERDVADSTQMLAEFPSGAMIYLAGATVNEKAPEDMIRGNKATVTFSGSKMVIQPERPFSDEIEGVNEQLEGHGENHDDHRKNWIDCIRTNGTPNCNIELATRVQTIVSLAERSYRKSVMSNFDPVKLKVIA